MIEYVAVQYTITPYVCCSAIPYNFSVLLPLFTLGHIRQHNISPTRNVILPKWLPLTELYQPALCLLLDIFMRSSGHDQYQTAMM